MPFLIGIAGGSGSGKSTVTKKIASSLSADGNIVTIEMDSYYCDHPQLSFEERGALNYDHPAAMDFDRLHSDIQSLMDGNSIERPNYDFMTHRRLDKTTSIAATTIVVVEGILTFHDARLREMCDMRLFVDTDADIRVLRRIKRDMKHRGRSFDEIRNRWYETVKPMYDTFVDPTRRYADMVIPEGGSNSRAIETIAARLRHWLREGTK
ncbi:uridine kinase [bacterium]|nr:uridine kinase [bacterium]